MNMNEQELRERIVNTITKLKEKIVSIVGGAMIEADELPFIETIDNIADALIAAGIGDVSELQKECDSKEEAYNKCYFDFKHWKDKAKEFEHRVEIAEAENAELRAKLKESGGLTTYKIYYDGVLGKFFISKYTEKYEFIGNFDTEQEAEKKLAELKGEKK